MFLIPWIWLICIYLYKRTPFISQLSNCLCYFPWRKFPLRNVIVNRVSIESTSSRKHTDLLCRSRLHPQQDNRYRCWNIVLPYTITGTFLFSTRIDWNEQSRHTLSLNKVSFTSVLYFTDTVAKSVRSWTANQLFGSVLGSQIWFQSPTADNLESNPILRGLVPNKMSEHWTYILFNILNISRDDALTFSLNRKCFRSHVDKSLPTNCVW